MDFAESSECRISCVHKDDNADWLQHGHWRWWNRHWPMQTLRTCAHLSQHRKEKDTYNYIIVSIRDICPKWWVPLLAQWQQMSISHSRCYKVNVLPWQPWGQKGQVWYNEPKPIVTVVTTHQRGDIARVVIIPCSENPSCSLSWDSVSLAPHWPSDHCL